MPEIDYLKSFHTGAQLLPERLWRAAYTLGEEQRQQCEELRIRIGRPFMATVRGKQVPLGDGAVLATKDELETLLDRATECSVHSCLEQLWQGYLTTRHGHRLGICGQAPQGESRLLRDLSSVNIRIARQITGLGSDLKLEDEKGYQNTLILAPPGTGKTTLLRELCRRLSYRYRVSIVDERYEIAACSGGAPRFHVGNCDVISGGSKHESISMVLRAMAPQIIAVDEITKAEDCRCLLECIGCGCGLLTTAHGRTTADLYDRPIYRTMIESGLFQQVILICRNRDGFAFQMETLS